MTLAKAIENFDAERGNKVSLERKIEWISQVDYKISAEILEDRGGEPFEGYTVSTPQDTVLKAPDTFGELYTLYLGMKMDYVNGEIGHFNNSANLFNRLYKGMFDYINRTCKVTKKNSIKAGDIIV